MVHCHPAKQGVRVIQQEGASICRAIGIKVGKFHRRKIEAGCPCMAGHLQEYMAWDAGYLAEMTCQFRFCMVPAAARQRAMDEANRSDDPFAIADVAA